MVLVGGQADLQVLRLGEGRHMWVVPAGSAQKQTFFATCELAGGTGLAERDARPAGSQVSGASWHDAPIVSIKALDGGPSRGRRDRLSGLLRIGNAYAASS